jgi:hypothetical protein
LTSGALAFCRIICRQKTFCRLITKSLLASAFGFRDDDFLKVRLYALHEANLRRLSRYFRMKQKSGTVSSTKTKEHPDDYSAVFESEGCAHRWLVSRQSKAAFCGAAPRATPS